MPASDPVTDRLLQAARQEFELVGIRRASMTEIVRRAGYTRTTLYKRFADKDSLVAAVVALEVTQAIATIEAALATVTGAEETISTLTVTLLRGMREHPLLRRMLQTEPEQLARAIAEQGNAGLALGTAFVADRIRRLQAAGELPPGDPDIPAEMLARITTSMLFAPTGHIPFENDDEIREFARRHLVPLFRHQAT